MTIDKEDKQIDQAQVATSWLLSTLRAMVDDCEAVFVGTYVQDDHTRFAVSVAAADMGKVVGKQGRTARALRTIFYAMARKSGTRYELEIEQAAK